MDGHIASRCPNPILNPVARPTNPILPPAKPRTDEPGFEELLNTCNPGVHTAFPAPSIQKSYSFVNRDAAYFEELARLQNAVIVYTEGQEPPVSEEQIVDMAVDTKLVEPSDISVGALPNERFLLHLPAGVAVETFIKKTSPQLWDMGISFQQWTPIEDASVNIPPYKVLLDFTGIPVHLWKDSEVIRAVSGFGVYLGRVPSKKLTDLKVWRAAVAAEELENIPPVMTMVAGGLEHDVKVSPVAWKREPIYKRSDLPMLPPIFKKPRPLSSSEDSDEDMFSMSREILIELCRDRDPESLPLPVRAALAGAKSMGPFMKPQRLATENPSVRIPVSVATAPQFQNLPKVQTQNQSPNPSARITTQSSGVAGRNELANVILLTNTQRSTPQRTNRGTNLEASSPRVPSSVQGHVGDHSTPRAHPHRATGSGRNPRAWPQDVAGQSNSQARPASPFSQHPPDFSGDRQKNKAAINLAPSASPASRGKDNHQQGATPSLLARTGVSSSEKTLNEFRQGVRLKRKTTWAFKAGRADGSGPSKRPTSKKNRQAERVQVNLDPEGFYAVRVDYAHCSKLAKEAGLSSDVIIQTVQEDNRERQLHMLNQPNSLPQASLPLFQDDDMEERVHLSDSDDELGSQDEGA